MNKEGNVLSERSREHLSSTDKTPSKVTYAWPLFLVSESTNDQVVSKMPSFIICVGHVWVYQIIYIYANGLFQSELKDIEISLPPLKMLCWRVSGYIMSKWFRGSSVLVPMNICILAMAALQFHIVIKAG